MVEEMTNRAAGWRVTLLVVAIAGCHNATRATPDTAILRSASDSVIRVPAQNARGVTHAANNNPGIPWKAFQLYRTYQAVTSPAETPFGTPFHAIQRNTIRASVTSDGRQLFNRID